MAGSIDPEGLFKRHPIGFAILVGVFILGLVALIVSSTNSLSENLNVPVAVISACLIGVVFIVVAWLCQHYWKKVKKTEKKANDAEAELAKARTAVEAEPQVIKENREKVRDLLKIGLNRVNPKVQEPAPVIEIELLISNLSIFDARIRKIAISLKCKAASSGDSLVDIYDGAYETEEVIPRQTQRSIRCNCKIEKAVADVVMGAAGSAKHFQAVVIFSGSANCYVSFEKMNELEVFSAIGLNVPFFAIPH